MAKKQANCQVSTGLAEKLCNSGEYRIISSGTVFLQAGVRPSGVWFIEEGVVEGIADYKNTFSSQVIEEFGVGEVVGWLGLIGENWIEHFRSRITVKAWFIDRDIFLDIFRLELGLQKWCRNQTPAIEVVDLMARLSSGSTRRLFQLSEWQHHYTINQIAQKEIGYSLSNLIDIPGGSWHFNDGSILDINSAKTLSYRARLVFLSSVREELSETISSISRTSLVLRANKSSLFKTLIILGNARGGTTMVAKIVSSLGVDIGTNSEEAISLEDKSFRYDLYNGQRHEDIVNQMKECIAKNNLHKGSWGWKYPMARHYLEDIIGETRNPHVICIFRDVLSCAMRQIRDGLDLDDDGFSPESSIADESIQCLKNIEMIKRLDLPTIICSYEKILSCPEDFIDLLSSFLGIEISSDIKNICLDAIHPGSYGGPISR